MVAEQGLRRRAPFEHDVAQPRRAAPVGEQALDPCDPLGIGGRVAPGSRLLGAGNIATSDRNWRSSSAASGRPNHARAAGPHANDRAAFATSEIGCRQKGLEGALLVDLGI